MPINSDVKISLAFLPMGAAKRFLFEYNGIARQDFRTTPRGMKKFPITMLRVQQKRRPENWDKRNSNLSGRFLPMDPQDETILDILEGTAPHGNGGEETYGPEGPPAAAYGESPVPAEPRKWSKRSEAARKRWADPDYRAKMLQKRAEKRRRDSEASSTPKIEIGVMDSITLADEHRAKAINAYARSNRLRSEKITAFHKNRKVWMENRLKNSPKLLSEQEKIQLKLDTRERRRQAALKRSCIKRSKQATVENTSQVGETALDNQKNNEDVDGEMVGSTH